MSMNVSTSMWAGHSGQTVKTRRREGHRETINRRAKEGWRYVGVIPVTQMGAGVVLEMDLVFEKEV